MFSTYIVRFRVLLNPTPTSSNVTLVKLLYFSINFHFYKMEKMASFASGLFNKYFVPTLGQALC